MEPLRSSAMEDYIFIILAIVLAVVGAFNKKKKRQPGNEAEERTPRNFLMDQLLGEDFLAEEPVSQKPMPAPEPSPVEKTQYKTTQTAQKKTVAGFNRPRIQVEKHEKMKGSMNVASEDIHEDEAATFQEGLREDFSLKKAVIYSTILEKKY